MAALGLPELDTSEDEEIPDGPKSAESRDLLGEIPSHHQTPIALEPAVARSNLAMRVA